MKAETELMKEMRGLRRDISLVLRRQDMILSSMVPVVEPTREEAGIMKAKKHFASEKDLFRALR